jgi:hypothetical protein
MRQGTAYTSLIDIAQNGIEAMPNGGTLTIRTVSGYYDKDKNH